ncbi:MAG TPA: hypothetical protein VHB46_06760 [Burkholderiales bacterium]|nr:hypothetical protein [Burkholderiales bacterium]
MRDTTKFRDLYRIKLEAESRFSEHVGIVVADTPAERERTLAIARAAMTAHKAWWAEAFHFVDWTGY